MSLSVNGIIINNLHFVGIFGIGMSAVAQFLADEISVSGSDRALDNESVLSIKKSLEALGCNLFNQDGSGITAHTSALVISTAIEDSNLDIAKAKELNIPVLHRSDILAQLVDNYRTISVTGTSGKSTVSSMIFHILNDIGANPSLIGGANLHSLKDRGLIGNSYKGTSDILVIEADESDGTVVKYHPEISVILNISKDHKSEEEVLEMMKIAVKNSKTSIVNNDDKFLRDFKEPSFGQLDNVNYKFSEVELNPLSSRFLLNNILVEIPIPGIHNVANATVAIGAVEMIGFSITNTIRALKNYKGVERRFDIYYSKNRDIVIDDYAHNPEKINAAITATKSIGKDIIAIFQPHGFGPLKFMFNELITMFNSVLSKTDKLILLPPYYAGGTVDKSIDSNSLRDRLKINVEVINSKDEVLDYISQLYNNETIIVLGARDTTLPQFVKDIVKNIDKGNDIK